MRMSRNATSGWCSRRTRRRASLAVAGLGDDRELRPRLGEARASAARAAAARLRRSARSASASTTHCGSIRESRASHARRAAAIGPRVVNRPRAPNNAARRSRTLASPTPSPAVSAFAAPDAARPRPVSVTVTTTAIAVAARADRDRAAVDRRLDAVLDRVLDERDQQVRRERVRRELGGHVDREVEARAHPHAAGC